MKKISTVLACLVLGIHLAILNQLAQAQKEIKLIADEEVTEQQMASDISGDSVIVGSHRHNFAKVFVRDGKNWEEQETLMPQFDGNVGWSVAISRDTAVVGAPNADAGAEKSGTAFVFVRSGKTWQQRAKLVGDNPEANDNFGESVSVDRNTVIIGVPRDDDAGRDAGSAYVFFRDGVTWTKQAKLIPADLSGSDAFGEAVFVRGNTAIIGANGHTHGGKRFTGAAYVFVRNGNRWVQQAKLTVEDGGKADRFGTSVGFIGKTIVVGAPFYDSENAKDVGAAYVFVPDGKGWTLQAKLRPEDSGKGHNFGAGVATTGNIVIVGSPGYDRPERGSGAAYSFVREDGDWRQKARVTPEHGARDLNFGYAVSMSENTVTISSHSKPFLVHDGWPNGDGNAAYVYNTIEDFDTPPFAIEPFGLSLRTFGGVKRAALFQNFPNPFNPETWIPYRLAADAPVMLRIHNVQGQLIRELDLGEHEAGRYLSRETAAYWDGRDDFGESVSSGLYFYTLHASEFHATRKMLILK
ncbi:MAG: hypothetical protein OXN17_20405 [Candidatus Poribacteria bacterium]|nr:hypothetical protein [Candidatus Poribacteria bacterium]